MGLSQSGFLSLALSLLFQSIIRVGKDLSSYSVQCNIPTMWLPRLNLNISGDRELTPMHAYVGLTFMTTTKRLVVILVTLYEEELRHVKFRQCAQGYICSKLQTPNVAPSRLTLGFPGGTGGKESTCHCRRHRRCEFNPWVRKIPWRRAWQPTPVFLPGKSQDRGAWQATVNGVTKSQTGLCDFTFTFQANSRVFFLNDLYMHPLYLKSPLRWR